MEGERLEMKLKNLFLYTDGSHKNFEINEKNNNASFLPQQNEGGPQP